MFLLSLLVDLPAENWKNSPDFKNGPILRCGLIIFYFLCLIVLYKEKDFVHYFYSSNPSEVRKAKSKLYIYHIVILTFIIYAFSHETMDPAI